MQLNKVACLTRRRLSKTTHAPSVIIEFVRHFKGALPAAAVLVSVTDI